MPPDLRWQDAPGGEGEYTLTNDLTAVVTRDRNAPLPSLEWRVKIMRDRATGMMQVLRDGHSATLPGARTLAEQFLIEVRWDLTASVVASRLGMTP